MVICLERGADLHAYGPADSTALTVSCFSKTQIGFTFLVPAHPGSPGQRPLNGCVCVYCRERLSVLVCLCLPSDLNRFSLTDIFFSKFAEF